MKFFIISQADQRRVTINFIQNAEFTVLLHKNRPNYHLCINYTPNPNFQIKQLHYMNIMKVNCALMSAILAVYAVT
jgi:hypothetical protein